MPHLHATLTPDCQIFFWSALNALEAGLRSEFPELAELPLTRKQHVMAAPGTTLRRRKVPGVQLPVHLAIPALLAAPKGSLTDSIEVFAHATRLALELASAHRVVPTTRDGHARWRALLSRPADEARFVQLAAALPVAARAIPTRNRGAIRLRRPEHVLRTFLDTTVDGIFRQGAFPGSTRGWAVDFADALRTDQSQFSPREARLHGVPGMIAAWSSEAMSTQLRLSLGLEFPTDDAGPFILRPWVHESGKPMNRMPVEDTWGTRGPVSIGGRSHEHAPFVAVRGLATVSYTHLTLPTICSV